MLISGLELKSGILEMVYNIHDDEMLKGVYDLLSDLVSASQQGELLTSEDEIALDNAIRDLDDPNQWVQHEEILRMLKK
ncbi:MAG: hypothetical protein SGI94_09015 [Saprospiraceae bacterium]|nr:hypothetical protein [Saprospiraceae bacterium]